MPGISDLIDSRKSNGQRLLMLVLFAGLAVVGLNYWHEILPFLLDIVYDSTKLVWGLAALVGSVLFLLHPKVHMVFSYILGSIANQIIKEFVDIDSIGILRTYVRKVEARTTAAQDIIGSIRGQRDHTKKAIAKNEEERKRNLDRAHVAQKLAQEGSDRQIEYKGALTLSSRQAGRMKRLNIRLEPLLARQEKLLKDLEAMYQAGLVMKEDLKAEIDAQIQEFEITTQGFKGMKLAMSMMAKNGPEQELVSDSLNNLSSKCDDMLGRMDMMMDVSKGILVGVDLDNMMFDEAALKELEDWDRDHSGTAGLSTPPLTGVRVDAGKNVRIGEVEEASPDSFGSLFNDNENKSGRP
jgi:hypothetical protein